MISAEYLSNIVYVIEYHLGNYAVEEQNNYKYGSFVNHTNYRGGISYLELYYLILSHALNILNQGLDYTDYNLTTSDLVYIIDKSNELMFYYGKYSV